MARRLFSQHRRLDLFIELNHSNKYSEHSYSTGDLVEGRVLLHFHEAIVIESFSISLGGCCTSVVTSLQPWAREPPSTRITHTFLMMEQPIGYQTLPQSSLADAGSSHDVPFCFTIPVLLLPDACRHGSDQESPLSRTHRQLPPSLGRPESGDHVEDLASENARVEYKISACLKTRSSQDGSLLFTEKEIPIRIVPISEPNPPLAIEKGDSDYQLCAAADVCWGVLRPSSSDGHLVLHTRQPSPLRVPTTTGFDSSSTSTPTPTHVTTSLEFFPRQSLGRPPLLESVKIRLRAFNYSAALPFMEPPRPSRHKEPDNLYNIRSKTIDLESHCVDYLVWEKYSDYERSATARRSLGNGSSPQEDSQWTEGRTTSHTASPTAPMYRASLNIPISLSREKLVLVPTFESCIIGRNYSLELTYFFRRSSSTPVLDSPDTSEDSSSPRSSGDYPNIVVSGIASKSRILSKTKKLTLDLPLQIIYDNSLSHVESRAQSNSPVVGSCPSQLCTPTDHTLPAQLGSSASSYTEKIAQTRHLENGWNESPPSYCPAFRSGQSAMRE